MAKHETVIAFWVRGDADRIIEVATEMVPALRGRNVEVVKATVGSEGSDRGVVRVDA